MTALSRFDPASGWRNALGVGGMYLVASAGAVTYWRATGASPGAGDLALWLLLVPTALSLAGLGLWRRWSASRARNAHAETVTRNVALPRDTATGPAASAAPLMRVLAFALWLPAGRDAFEVIDTLREQRRPRLHPTLRDLHGFPVTVADIEGVDEAGADGAFGANDDETAQRRALALLRPVAEELLLAALPPPATDWADATFADAGPAMHPYAMHHSQSARAPAAPQRATLRIALMVPAPWLASTRVHASTQLHDLASALGHDGEHTDVQCIPIEREADIWDWLAQQASALREPTACGDRLLLLAADSSVSDWVIERWATEDRLLRSAVTEGEVPGEGAAGLLLAAPDAQTTHAGAKSSGHGGAATRCMERTDRTEGTDATCVHLHPPLVAAVGQASRARDAARIGGELIAGALHAADCNATLPLQAITTADHRPSRMTEAATALASECPNLDPVEDALHLGVSCGSLGVVAPVALLAVAAMQARATATPTLAYSLADATTRAVVVMSPVVDEPHPPADATSAA